MIILAIDPGISPGFAACDEHAKVIWASQGAKTFPAHLLPLKPCVLIERPTIRPGHPRPNDILDLAVTFGAYAQWCLSHGADVFEVLPSAWKGSASKKVHHAQVAAKVSADLPGAKSIWDLAVKEGRTDQLDAMALLAWLVARVRAVGWASALSGMRYTSRLQG